MFSFLPEWLYLGFWIFAGKLLLTSLYVFIISGYKPTRNNWIQSTFPDFWQTLEGLGRLLLGLGGTKTNHLQSNLCLVSISWWQYKICHTYSQSKLQLHAFWQCLIVCDCDGVRRQSVGEHIGKCHPWIDACCLATQQTNKHLRSSETELLVSWLLSWR